jgi:hypothetical protein
MEEVEQRRDDFMDEGGRATQDAKAEQLPSARREVADMAGSGVYDSGWHNRNVRAP